MANVNLVSGGGSSEDPTDWSEVAASVDGRNAKQCRDRWLNTLRPGLVKGKWTSDEESIIILHVKEHGPQWHRLSKMMTGRSENAIKNKWNSMQRSAMRKKKDNIII